VRHTLIGGSGIVKAELLAIEVLMSYKIVILSLKTFTYEEINIRQFTRVETKINHRGCVNTAKWYKNGEFLVTGSDDRTAKVSYQKFVFM